MIAQVVHNVLLERNTRSERKITHDKLIKAWEDGLPPVGEARVSNQNELEQFISLLRTGVIGPGSKALVTGPYALKLHATYVEFCKERAKQRDEAVNLVLHSVKLATLATSFGLGPLGSIGKATLLAAPAIVTATSSLSDGRESKIKMIKDVSDIFEVSVAIVGVAVRNNWNERILMSLVSATLVREMLFNGAFIEDNDGESISVKWGNILINP